MKFEQANVLPEQDIDSDDFYVRLGVSKDADFKEIKTSYRKLAMKYHPDARGDEENFKRLQEAYEYLEKRSKSEQSSYTETSSERSKQRNPHSDHRREKKEKYAREKPKERPFGKRKKPEMGERLVDTVDPNDLERYRMLNRLAREVGKDAPYPFADEQTLSEYITEELDRRVKEKMAEEKLRKERNERSYAREQPEEKMEPLINGRYKKETLAGYWVMTESGGKELSRSYFDIQKVGPHIVAVDSIDYKTLLDSKSGRELSKSYAGMKMLGPYLLGIDSIDYKTLIDPKSGRGVSDSYADMRMIGSYLVGVDSIDYKTLLDSRSGKKLSKSYSDMRLIGPHLVAVDSIDYKTLIDPKTGRELSKFYPDIRVVGSHLIGIDSIGRRERIL